MQSYHNKTLAEIITENPSAASLLEAHALDYCCKGKRSLAKACEENQLNPNILIAELHALHMNSEQQKVPINFSALQADALVDYIVTKHHTYVKHQLPIIHAHLVKLQHKHGIRFPEINSMIDIFSLVQDELEQHMLKEEKILFPHIKNLVAANNDSTDFGVQISFIQNPIHVMEHEHEQVGHWMSELKRLSLNYNPPQNACNTHKLSFMELNEFEQDLHMHIHLENNILFPKAIQAEKELIRKTIASIKNDRVHLTD